jgi:hypothetical protein
MAASVATGSPLPESGVLQGGADANVDALIEQSRQLAARPLGDRDRLASLLLAVPFLVVSVALVVFAHSSRQVGLWTFGVFVVSYALASRIDFEIGTGSAVPTQLVLVPMLVLLPVQFVPLCVLVGLLLGGLPDYARGRVPIARSVLRFVNSWHAVGPALVLIAAGQPEPTLRHLPIYALAFVAQFAFDFGSTALRDRLGLGVSPWSLVRFMVWIWAVDLALTPIAILAALGCVAHPWLVVFSLPLLGLLAYFARERQVRIDHALELSHAYRGTAMLLGDVVEADDCVHRQPQPGRRLSRRARRREHSSGRAHCPGVRRLQRDDHRSLVPQSAPGRGSGRGAPALLRNRFRPGCRGSSHGKRDGLAGDAWAASTSNPLTRSIAKMRSSQRRQPPSPGATEVVVSFS